ncbi:MAG: hypothetical protein RLZ25_2409 [Pseudomonadota bacterium]|jgi:hypothetical protein
MAEKVTPTTPSKTPAKKPRERLLKTRPRASEAVPLAAEKEHTAIAPEKKSDPEGPRFQFFLIDSGWDGPAAHVIRQNLRMVTQLQNHDPFYVLTRSQSSEILKRHPHLIGKDPILLARDIHGARYHGRKQYHGFHLNLGIIQNPEDALEVLQNFVNFLAVHRKNANIEHLIKQKLHRDGLQGAVEVLRGGSEQLV